MHKPLIVKEFPLHSLDRAYYLDMLSECDGPGGLRGVSPLRAALAQKLGRRVAASVVYRMLARHGWRKVAPDTRHPKSDSQVQEDWKKNGPKTWQPSPNQRMSKDDECD